MQLRGLSRKDHGLVEDIRGSGLPQDGDWQMTDVTDVGREGQEASGADEDSGDWIDEVDDEGTFAHALRDILDSRWKQRWYKDPRTWQDHRKRMDEHWGAVLPKLIDAYIAWRYPTPSSTNAQPSQSPGDHEHGIDNSTANDNAPDQPPPNVAADGFNIRVFDIYSLAESAYITRPATFDSEAPCIVASGYLGTTPIRPSLAISLRSLELLRSIRRFKASYSVEAFAKLLCYYYKITYERRYREMLFNAYEIYLAMVRGVEKRVRGVLGRDSPNWRVLNACPPCGYQLDNEPDLRWQRMLCLDGNNSLKRLRPLGNRTQGDTRVFADSDYYLPQDFVDTFAHEVKSRRDDSSAADLDHEVEPPDDRPQIADTGGDPADDVPDDSPLKTCTQNWKAAAAEANQKMWGILTRQGFSQSGELAKYPLAITSKALETFDGAILQAYDIGCSFGSIIANSRLGPQFERRRCRSCVNAFHGYTHNYACQCNNHPNVIEGMGLQDMETLERIFSASNHLASVTCYATPYRRRLLIDEFFSQWDDEKYANLSQYIYNNFVQASKIIETETPALAETMESLRITFDDLERWYVEERKYFETLGKETPWDVHAMAYVEALEELRTLTNKLDVVSDNFLATIPSDYNFQMPATGAIDYAAETSRTRKLETEKRHLRERYNAQLADVMQLEETMGITRRWEPTDESYLATAKYIANREYLRALDNLQRLVVQRLFELHKLNLQNTAYRVRTHIAKALQKRSKAIQNAVKVYNAAAVALNPPRPTVDWSKVSHYSFLDEFALLQDTRDDVREKPWSTPLAREVMRKARRLDRAREELKHCQVEALRLYTSIADELDAFTSALIRLRAEGSPLWGAAKEYCARRLAVNTRHISRLEQLASLDGFSAVLQRGHRKGTSPVASNPAASPPSESLSDMVGTSSRAQDIDKEDEGDSDDDELEGDIGALVDFIAT
ncbi:hypothetical protein EVJ58_g10360 [Rhodofomes roseus]|uniref:CxC2-like cysteine cluster KDZ transposase-associated domain-containing protein n=1 Tax=Rhodofomes roseus TaxID=34475 RepID=A0A4Y9XNZ5_9APHY|nr:hypothetical protein EVJ58_g10360 [Rhodofomes roseus]